jgi:hypothetical protein
MLEYKYDTQLLIEGDGLSEDTISEYITNNIKGDCLLAVGDESLIKIHFHTNTPWKVLEYCASLGEISATWSWKIWSAGKRAAGLSRRREKGWLWIVPTSLT